jgi:hypothetical protein
MQPLRLCLKMLRPASLCSSFIARFISCPFRPNSFANAPSPRKYALAACRSDPPPVPHLIKVTVPRLSGLTRPVPRVLVELPHVVARPQPRPGHVAAARVAHLRSSVWVLPRARRRRLRRLFDPLDGRGGPAASARRAAARTKRDWKLLPWRWSPELGSGARVLPTR